MVPIVCVVGKTGAGKTHVIEMLVAELKNRGYRVATIKHSAHGFDLDQPAKDSWRHAQAGSDAVVISSPQKFALIRKVDHDSSLAELSRFIGSDFDIILAEGFKQDKAPKIEVHRQELGRDLLCAQEELLALATDESMDLNIPQYSPDDALGLVDLIEKRYLNKEEEEVVSLFVNGEPVPLNDFVRGLFSNTLFGMVSSLKRIPQAISIDISVRRKARE
ncbi:MAG: molybdopterin-guanine dinucleotide biosynthesis protein B [Dehalococcoidia bacterium]|nr:MAG: molybdopterin-guanine dinucleotide biosynthesis protein B [Dehalococcoidia bacterium]